MKKEKIMNNLVFILLYLFIPLSGNKAHIQYLYNYLCWLPAVSMGTIKAFCSSVFFSLRPFAVNYLDNFPTFFLLSSSPMNFFSQSSEIRPTRVNDRKSSVGTITCSFEEAIKLEYYVFDSDMLCPTLFCCIGVLTMATLELNGWILSLILRLVLWKLLEQKREGGSYHCRSGRKWNWRD